MRRKQPEARQQDPAALAYEALTASLVNATAGCCSKQFPCRYHHGFIDGANRVAFEITNRTGGS
jgi:hypothetical protein